MGLFSSSKSKSFSQTTNFSEDFALSSADNIATGNEFSEGNQFALNFIDNSRVNARDIETGAEPPQGNSVNINVLDQGAIDRSLDLVGDALNESALIANDAFTLAENSVSTVERVQNTSIGVLERSQLNFLTVVDNLIGTFANQLQLNSAATQLAISTNADSAFDLVRDSNTADGGATRELLKVIGLTAVGIAIATRFK